MDAQTAVTPQHYRDTRVSARATFTPLMFAPLSLWADPWDRVPAWRGLELPGIFFLIPQLISLIIFISMGTVECLLHSSFKYSSYFPNSPSHMRKYVLTIKLHSGEESIKVYRERRSGQTFSYINLCHRKNSTSHLPYELSKTLLNHTKTIFFATQPGHPGASAHKWGVAAFMKHFMLPKCLS